MVGDIKICAQQTPTNNVNYELSEIWVFAIPLIQEKKFIVIASARIFHFFLLTMRRFFSFGLSPGRTTSECTCAKSGHSPLDRFNVLVSFTCNVDGNKPTWTIDPKALLNTICTTNGQRYAGAIVLSVTRIATTSTLPTSSEIVLENIFSRFGNQPVCLPIPIPAKERQSDIIPIYTSVGIEGIVDHLQHCIPEYTQSSESSMNEEGPLTYLNYMAYAANCLFSQQLSMSVLPTFQNKSTSELMTLAKQGFIIKRRAQYILGARFQSPSQGTEQQEPEKKNTVASETEGKQTAEAIADSGIEKENVKKDVEVAVHEHVEGVTVAATTPDTTPTNEVKVSTAADSTTQVEKSSDVASSTIGSTPVTAVTTATTATSSKSNVATTTTTSSSTEKIVESEETDTYVNFYSDAIIGQGKINPATVAAKPAELKPLLGDKDSRERTLTAQEKRKVCREAQAAAYVQSYLNILNYTTHVQKETKDSRNFNLFAEPFYTYQILRMFTDLRDAYIVAPLNQASFSINTPGVSEGSFSLTTSLRFEVLGIDQQRFFDCFPKSMARFSMANTEL